jgi:adhesin transport system membrane fusion protein
LLNKDDCKFVDNLSFKAYEKPSMKANILFLMAISFIAFALIWAGLSSIDQIVKGQGKVIPSSGIKSIQASDGGLIKGILVKKGSVVKKGQKLIIIDDTRLSASTDDLKAQLEALKTEKVRLNIQSLMKDITAIPKLKFAKEKYSKSYIKTQQMIFKNEIEKLKGILKIDKSQLNQKLQEYNETLKTISNLRRSLGYIRKQLSILKEGFRQKVISKIDVIKQEAKLNDTVSKIQLSKLKF